MKRTDIINALIAKYGYKSYLEVGTQDPKSNFDLITAEHKVSIDPFPRGEVTFVGTSDEYFDSISDDVKFDIIFIDGLHEYGQLTKDCNNYYSKLKEGGIFAGHDYNAIPGVRQAADEFAAKVGKTIQITECDVWYWVK